MADNPREDVELKIEYVPVDELTFYVRNSKLHPRQQVHQIAESIKQFGNCDPIGVWTNARGEMEIVEGHGRVLALDELGIDTAPIIRLDHLSDDERRAYTHVHNQTTLSSGFDWELLDEDFKDLDFDWESFGFDWEENKTPEPRKSTESAGATEIDLDEFDDDKFEHECPRCGFRFNDGKTSEDEDGDEETA